MPSKTVGLCLAIAIVVLPISLSHAETHAHGHADEAHHHHAASATAMQLDNGSQWITGAPLRKAMATVSNEMRALLPAIHEDQLAVEQYEAIAATVNEQVTYIIENCGLEGEADAQLHLVIADLMAGANTMQGKVDDKARRDGAVRVVGALNNYGTYFDDASFEKLEH